jgi:DNA-3-methyladenine glycosylase
MAARLPRSFFARPATRVAPDLLGQVLVRRVADGSRLAGVIVEAEAYEPGDPASHAYRGPTPRNEVMFGRPGRLYVYFTYGNHWMANVVTRKAGEGSAVLLRAVRPIDGIETMSANRGRTDMLGLCSGPGKLAQAFAISREQNGEDLVAGSVVWLERGNGAVVRSRGPRVGVSVGVEPKWRFWVSGDPYVSKGRPGPPHPRRR